MNDQDNYFLVRFQYAVNPELSASGELQIFADTPQKAIENVKQLIHCYTWNFTVMEVKHVDHL